MTNQKTTSPLEKKLTEDFSTQLKNGRIAYIIQMMEGQDPKKAEDFKKQAEKLGIPIEYLQIN